MDQNHFTTDTLRKKGAHLTFEERVIIQTRLRDKQSYRSIVFLKIFFYLRKLAVQAVSGPVIPGFFIVAHSIQFRGCFFS
jgi:hypothetical protein